jgi:hypothetical protein
MGLMTLCKVSAESAWCASQVNMANGIVMSAPVTEQTMLMFLYYDEYIDIIKNRLELPEISVTHRLFDKKLVPNIMEESPHPGLLSLH